MMRDSVSASAIPADTPVVAGYADGLYAWSPADWARFPNAVKLSIAVRPATSADILDIETGDALPSDAPGWCDRFNRPGRRRPTLYCNLSNWPAVKAAVGARQVDYWVADYTGSPHNVPGAVACQYHDFGGYDESNIIDPTWVEARMTSDQDIARGLVYDLRAALLGDGPGTAGEAAAIEAYVAGVVTNVEGGLSALITDCQKDPRYIPARVAKLEAELGAIHAALS